VLYHTGFHFDPWFHLAVVWLKKRAFFAFDFDICTDTVCLFPENYTSSFEYFLHVKIFLFQLFAISSTLIRASIAVQGPLFNICKGGGLQCLLYC